MRLLAMVVDLGWWPWWGTTLVGAGVAVASAAGMTLTTRSFVRGVLVTLAVEGVVLAALAPVLMQRSSSSPTMARPTGTMTRR